jgi:predicted histidine transporter YuiF (NhaC family)
MTNSRKLLVLGGMALAALGMLYGLYYAVLVEHQTLDQMGGSLTQAFASAAQRNLSQSQTALEAYAATKYDYVRQVDAHSHCIGLGMLMIVLGVLFGRVNFSEAVRQAIAISLLAGSAVFPLAVILQTYHHGALIFKALAVVGPGLVIFGLAATAWGFARQRTLA